MAIGCALTVGNLYFVEPLLGLVAREFRVTEGAAGLAATLAKAGYALGMLLVIPLGDVRERRGLVVLSLVASVVALVAVALAPSFAFLCAATFAVGVATCTPQLLVPFAAELAAPSERGRAVGFVMSGLLVGILLARTFAGFVGGAFGWRAAFWTAALVSVGLLFALRRVLPMSRPGERLPYARLLGSVAHLVRTEPALRQAMLYGACLFGAFSAFWTTLAFHLEAPPFGLGPSAVGLFGLVGVAGALTAPVVGRLNDAGDPRRANGAGMLVALLSFGVFAVFGRSLWGIGAGVLLMDVGVQASHISNQSRIFGVRPEARSRMNTAYMASYFVGGAGGSGLGSWAWSLGGWGGVCAVGAGLSAVSLGVWATRQRRPGGASLGYN